jgi:hypothetical protein
MLTESVGNCEGDASILFYGGGKCFSITAQAPRVTREVWGSAAVAGDTGRATLPLSSIGRGKRHDTSKNLSGVRGLECPELTNSA